MTKVGIRPDLHPNTMKCHEIFNDHRLPASDCSQGKRVPLSAVPRTQHNASSKRRYSLRDCSHCSIHIVLGGFFSKHLNNPALVPLVLISAAGPSGRKYQMLQEIILRVTQRCWLQGDLSFPSSNRAALSLLRPNVCGRQCCPGWTTAPGTNHCIKREYDSLSWHKSCDAPLKSA